MKKLFFIVLLLIPAIGNAATYYARTDGVAANKEAATSCSAAATAMGQATVESETLAAGDTVCYCPDGGDYTDLADRIDSITAGVTYDFDCDGDGTKATFNFALNNYFWHIDVNGVDGAGAGGVTTTIKNFSGDCNSVNQTSIRIIDSNGIDILNNDTTNCTLRGIHTATTDTNSSYDILYQGNTDTYSRIGFSSEALNASSPIYNLTVNKNTATENGEAGVKLAGTTHTSTVSRNTITKSGASTGETPTFGTGVEIGATATNFTYDIIVEHNDVSLCEDAEANGDDGVGIRFDVWSRSGTARYNKITSTQGNGLMASNSNGYGHTVYGNILIGNNTESATWPTVENANIVVNDGTTGVGTASKVYNNTLIGGDRCIYIYESFDSPEIKNNLCYGPAAEGILIEEALFLAGNYVESNNLINTVGTYSLASILTFATVTDRSGSLDATSLTSDPIFIQSATPTSPKEARVKGSSPTYQGCPGVSLSEVTEDYCGKDINPNCVTIGAHHASRWGEWYSPGGACE